LTLRLARFPNLFRLQYASFGPYELRTPASNVSAADNQWVKFLWYDLLNRAPRESRSPSRRNEWVNRDMESFDPAVAVKVPITANAKTLIRLEIPDDLESRVRLAFAGETDAEKAKAAWSDGSPFHRSVKITVVGSEPLATGGRE
jgi:hypothetical protein